MEQITLKRAIDFKLPTAVLGGSLLGNDDTLVAGCMDGVYIADLSTKSFERIGEHDSYVSSAAYLPKHNAIVTAGYDGVLQWFDASSRESHRKLKVHDFWSWDMAVSPDQSWIASVTGQYLSGGYKYQPAAEREPSLRLIAATTGEVVHSLPHVPSVQAVALSSDSRLVAAGNLMGEVRIWDCQSGEQVGTFTTRDFTSWGIIKSHCYLGGIFAMTFTPDSSALLLCGMGPMRDPMAGNGRQLWQKWTWQQSEPQLLDQTHEGESGEGLMEAIAIDPGGEFFAVGGRLRGGDWNVALFELGSGRKLGQLKSGYRVTELAFTSDGTRLVVLGTQGQPGKNDQGEFSPFGRVEVYALSRT